MISDEDSSPEEAIEIAIKKNVQQHPIHEKKKIVKSKVKAKPKAKLPSGIQHLLSDKIQDEVLLKQLEAKPFDFGERENKIIKIAEQTQNRKEIKQLGLSLVHTLKKQKRVPVNHLQNLLEKSNSKRKDMLNVRNLRKNR